MTTPKQLGLALRAGLEIRSRTYLLKSYPKCFLGTEAVAFLQSANGMTLEEALKTGNRLIREKIFHHVCDDHLLENSRLFYRFYEDEDNNDADNKTDFTVHKPKKPKTKTPINKLLTTQQQLVKFRLHTAKQIADLEYQAMESNMFQKRLELYVEHQTDERKHSLGTLLRILLLFSLIIALQSLLLLQPWSGGWWIKNVVVVLGVALGLYVVQNNVQRVARRHNIPSSIRELLSNQTDKAPNPTTPGTGTLIPRKTKRPSSQKTQKTQKQQLQQPLHSIHPHFPSLQFREVLSNTVIHANSRAPIPFKTPTFDGQILIMLNTKPQDPVYAEHFGNRKRTMEVHIQGKFLQEKKKKGSNPTAVAGVDDNEQDDNEQEQQEQQTKQGEATLFIGGEINNAMTGLGTFSKGIASLMLKMIKMTSYGAFDSSFGNTSEGVLPHIVTSLYQGVDRFVKTPAGETPPPLGEDLPETEMERKKRGSSTQNLILDSTATYSFSYQTMYIDFLEWQVIRIPGFKVSFSFFFCVWHEGHYYMDSHFFFLCFSFLF